MLHLSGVIWSSKKAEGTWGWERSRLCEAISALQPGMKSNRSLMESNHKLTEGLAKSEPLRGDCLYVLQWQKVAWLLNWKQVSDESRCAGWRFLTPPTRICCGNSSSRVLLVGQSSDVGHQQTFVKQGTTNLDFWTISRALCGRAGAVIMGAVHFFPNRGSFRDAMVQSWRDNFFIWKIKWIGLWRWR